MGLSRKNLQKFVKKLTVPGVHKKDTAFISPSVWQLEKRFIFRYAAAQNCPLRG
jgi:hypothetical protein